MESKGKNSIPTRNFFSLWLYAWLTEAKGEGKLEKREANGIGETEEPARNAWSAHERGNPPWQPWGSETSAWLRSYSEGIPLPGTLIPVSTPALDNRAFDAQTDTFDESLQMRPKTGDELSLARRRFNRCENW